MVGVGSRPRCSGIGGGCLSPASDNSFLAEGLDICAWEADHMRMGNKAKAKSIGAMLARLRWSKATEADRKAQGRKMHAGLRKARKHRQAKARGTK